MDDQYFIWNALGELDDYFSRLGGSARYWGMPDIDIELFLGGALLNQYDDTFSLDEWVGPSFLKVVTPIKEQVDNQIKQINAKNEDFINLLVGFIYYIDDRPVARERDIRWEKYKNKVRELKYEFYSYDQPFIDSLLEQYQSKNRVCPNPIKWNELYEMLPNKTRNKNGSIPDLPLVLAAWNVTAKSFKNLRFREHIIWAADHGCLLEIIAFLNNLTEDDWFHFDD